MHTKVVKSLKEKYKNLPRLGFSTSSDNLILETDASYNHWGAVLKTYQEKICRNASETFKLAKKNYHSNEKELLAIKNRISEFIFFSLLKKFKVRSDNTQVKGFIFNKLPNLPQYKRLIRWQLFFVEYDFEIEFIKGSNNCIADFLSREYNGKDPFQNN